MATIDFSTDEAARTFVAGLTREQRDTLTDALTEAADTDRTVAILAAIRTALAEDLHRVAGVIFYADAWPNGYFIDAYGTILYTDGDDPHVFQFPDPVQELLTDLHGIVGGRAGWAVIPSTGDTSFAESNAREELEPWITSMTTRKQPTTV